MEIITKAISDAREWQNYQDPKETSTQRSPGQTRPAPIVRDDTSIPTCYIDAAWDARSGFCGLGDLFSGSPALSRLPQLSESGNMSPLH
ncbi:hypothetical protein Bca4012_052233 [Brassica carinata]|uniref:Uncharacterized protein n=2 Tax=Brassica TaxID=3705 RepID=A0A8X7RB99_BRACI|nr:hypothetical protein Bca52824_054798 [Brassica carinata]